MKLFIIFFLAKLVAWGGAAVTSQEQFGRLGEGGSPYNLKYNFDRAYLEARTSTYCPSDSKAFFFVHISEDGSVKSVRGHLVGLSADLRNVALKWAVGALKQMHFKPLLYGTKRSSVDMALTLVCTDGLDQAQGLASTAATHP